MGELIELPVVAEQLPWSLGPDDFARQLHAGEAKFHSIIINTEPFGCDLANERCILCGDGFPWVMKFATIVWAKSGPTAYVHNACLRVARDTGKCFEHLMSETQ